MKLRSNLHRDILCLTILSTAYIVSMLVAAIYTSPLYPNVFGHDSALFSLLGKGVLEGKILYADLFDHKGPFIFLINALGYFLGGHSGIFAVQCVCGIVSMVFLYATAKMLDTNHKHTFVPLAMFAVVYAVFFRIFEGGNLTEEYSQPVVSASLYLFVKYAVQAREHVKHPPVFAFFYGVFLVTLAFLRLTNAVTVCAGILAIFVYLLYKKSYRNLVCNLLAGLGGMAAVAVPVCIYFWRHSALYDMIYATFLYNFNIVGNTGVRRVFEHVYWFFLLYAPVVISALLLIVHIASERKVEFLDILLGCILVGNIYIFSIANRYAHYFAMFMPVYLVFLIRYFHLNWKKVSTYLLAILIVGCSLLNLPYLYSSVAEHIYSCYVSKSAEAEYHSVREITDCIPEEERGSVILYELPVSYYVLADIVPCYKYYTWQENWAVVDPEILVEFMDWIQNDKPQWVLIKPQEDNQTILTLLECDYELVAQNELMSSYRLK